MFPGGREGGFARLMARSSAHAQSRPRPPLTPEVPSSGPAAFSFLLGPTGGGRLSPARPHQDSVRAAAALGSSSLARSLPPSVPASLPPRPRGTKAAALRGAPLVPVSHRSAWGCNWARGRGASLACRGLAWLGCAHHGLPATSDRRWPGFGVGVARPDKSPPPSAPALEEPDGDRRRGPLGWATTSSTCRRRGSEEAAGGEGAASLPPPFARKEDEQQQQQQPLQLSRLSPLPPPPRRSAREEGAPDPPPSPPPPKIQTVAWGWGQRASERGRAGHGELPLLRTVLPPRREAGLPGFDSGDG